MIEQELVKTKVAIILFYDNKGNILLQDRKNYSKFGEEYGFFGGTLKEGETPEEALKREIREELGLEINDYHLFKTYRRVSPEINRDATLNVYLDLMPDIKKIKIGEGDIAIMKFEESFNLKMIPGNVELLKEIYRHLNKK